MPFGLCNAPATFQRLMEKVLATMQWKDCLVYIDDVLVWSSTFADHISKLRGVFEVIRKAGLRLKTEKCRIVCESAPFLGHLLTRSGLRMNPERVKAVQMMGKPTNKQQLESFLGIVGYYRRFAKDLSRIERPLRDLCKQPKFEWNEASERAFQAVKEVICRGVLLFYPDPNKPFVLDTDASDAGLDTVLSPLYEEGNERPVCFASRTLTDPEKKWSTMEK